MEILFQDKDIAVCVKPAGLDSQQQLPQKLQELLGGTFYTLHRLDLNVGGVMVYARNQETAAKLSALIARGEMKKEYVAIVKGTTPESATWEDFLFKDSRKNKVFVVKKERAGVKKAKLSFRTLSAGETSLVHILLYTGRSHQIRVQFASRKFPLLGDHKYGARDENKAPLLYSCRVSFPYQGKYVSFQALPVWAQDAKLDEWK